MKKKRILAIAIATILISAIFASCRSNKPPCPAYQSINIENIFTNFSK